MEKHPERAEQQARVVELLAEGVQPSVPNRTVALGKGLEMAFAWVPPGTFLMGSPPDEDGRFDNETQHRVTLTKGFWLAVTPVTQAQWKAVMGSNPSHSKGDNLPVETVSWHDCQDFCRKLGEKLGQRFRLPTETEWEYACRAGTTTPFHFGTTISTDQASYDRAATTPVGSFPANAWGLRDVHGDVREWCEDGFGGDPSNNISDTNVAVNRLPGV